MPFYGNSRRVNRGKRFLPVLLFITLIAFLFRLIAGFELLKNDPAVFAPNSATDMATYLKFASEILHGKWPDTFYYQPYYYAVFLPLVQLITGPSEAMIIFFQTLSGGLSVYFSGLTGALIGGKKGGILSAVFLGFSLMAVLYTPYALMAVVQLFHFTLLLYLTLRAFRSGRMIFWALTGFCLSLAILTRGNAWCFLPVILGALILQKKIPKKTKFVQTTVLFLAILLPQLPFAIYNTLKTGHLSGPSTAGSAVLALGNSPESPAGGLEYPLTYEVWIKNEKTRSVPMRIFDWALEEPAAFAVHQLKKVFLFWDHEEISNNIIESDCIRKSRFLQYVPLFPTYVFMPLALAALFLSFFRFRTRKKMLLIAALFLLFYNLAAAAFYILARFRVPALGSFAVLAGFFLADLLHGWKMKKYRTLLRSHGTALLFAVLITGPGYRFYETYYEDSVMRLVRPDGIRIRLPGLGTMVCDNGPSGGWGAAEKQTFIKTFSAEPELEEKTPVHLRIRFFREDFSVPSGFSFTVNGKTFTGTFPERELFCETEIASTAPADGKYEFSLPESNVHFLLDTHRSYGRTFDGEGKVLPAELVVKLIF